MQTSQNVDIKAFGRGQAKSLQDLWQEVSQCACHAQHAFTTALPYVLACCNG